MIRAPILSRVNPRKRAPSYPRRAAGKGPHQEGRDMKAITFGIFSII